MFFIEGSITVISIITQAKSEDRFKPSLFFTDYISPVYS